ncbi:hypothetical protein EVAR_100305_1 [Eumeta japonica]|uniref:Uncharacterized protein n=1 Tax=Eumeta variegata TaxID=151549 RepID=A0A4C1ZVU7_EUMVA|nr:hypothetical protein EVAR_100305_1 [Eumeta japonica]
MSKKTQYDFHGHVKSSTRIGPACGLDPLRDHVLGSEIVKAIGREDNGQATAQVRAARRATGGRSASEVGPSELINWERRASGAPAPSRAAQSAPSPGGARAGRRPPLGDRVGRPRLSIPVALDQKYSPDYLCILRYFSISRTVAPPELHRCALSTTNAPLKATLR